MEKTVPLRPVPRADHVPFESATPTRGWTAGCAACVEVLSGTDRPAAITARSARLVAKARRDRGDRGCGGFTSDIKFVISPRRSRRHDREAVSQV